MTLREVLVISFLKGLHIETSLFYGFNVYIWLRIMSEAMYEAERRDTWRLLKRGE